MSDLGPDARALIESARNADDPTPGDDARMRRALVGKLGIGIGLAAGTVATSTAAATTSAGVVVKSLVALAIVGGISAGGNYMYHAYDPGGSVVGPRVEPPAPSSETLAIASALPAPLPVPAPASTPAPAPEKPLVVTTNRIANSAPRSEPESPPVLLPVQHVPSRTVQEPPVAPPAPPTRDTLEDETRLLREAAVFLRAHDGASALGRLDEHARRFPHGLLAEERAGERVFSLCEMGRVGEAQRAAAEFLAQNPRSPLAHRVRAACVSPQ